MLPLRHHLIIAATAALSLSAAHANERQYGAGAPFQAEDLPPGLLKSGLNALPAQARSRAMEWLHSFSFPASDVAQIRVDATGGIYYVDPKPAEGETSTTSSSAIPNASDVFMLHSKPGASRKIFVDFDGAIISGTAWNTDLADPLYAKAFDTDGDPQTFNDSERNAIAEVWHRIAEDYAAFDVDITTEDPGSFDPQTGHLLITYDEDLNGNPMPAQGAGGVAYVNVWGISSYPTRYSPAFVYADNLGPNFAPYLAEAGSHEAGHNLGLSHDGTSGSSYYAGHGSGWVSWGPIMGTGYRDNVSQWSKGEYAGANNQQDDIAIILSKLSARADDHGDDAASATLLQVAADGSVLASNPETDPFNLSPDNKGIIGTAGDVDVFLINAGSGTLNLSITPSWAAWPRSSTQGRGTNLDIQASLHDQSGVLISSADPLDETNAQINATVTGGFYTLTIRGVGNSLSPYSDYGSQGQYFISGSVPVGEPDTQAPSPNPMQWAEPPAATGFDSISMSAVIASDDRGGEVQYLFSCVAGGAGCLDSGWQSNTSYVASGLDAATEYQWVVRARDLAGNETAASVIASATTEAAPQQPAAPSGLLVSDTTSGSAVLNWSDNSDNESGFEILRESYHQKRRRWQSTSLIATTGADVVSLSDASGSGLFRYRVRAINAIGASAYTAWVEVNVTDASSGGGGGGGGCKGGPKKCG